MRTAINKVIFKKINYFFLILIFFIISIIYFYKIKFFPNFGGDESSLLNIAYRAVTFGDLHYPVFFPQSAYDAGFQRAYPPINALCFRILFHFIFGFSAELSRIFSAIITLLSLLTILVVCQKRYQHLSSWVIIPAAIVIGLTPAMVVNARSTRFEQEVLFWGVLGTFGLLTILSKSYSKRLAWFFSGFFIGLAMTTHPFGIVFPCVVLLSFFLHRKAWHVIDSLTIKQRIGAWGGGLLIPVTITLIDILYKFQGYMNYTKAAKEFYLIRKQQFIDSFSNEYSGKPFHQFLPAKIKAFLYQISHYGFSTEFMPFLVKEYTILLFLSVVLCFSFLLLIFKERNQKNILLLAISTYLAIGFFLMTFFYPPNQTYYIYLSFSLSTFVCIAYIYLLINKNREFYSKIMYCCITVNFFSLFLVNVIASFFLIRMLFYIDNNKQVSLDAIYKTQQKLRTDMGLPEFSLGETITDSYTWPFAGKNTGSWTTTLGGFKSHEPIAAAFRTDAMDFFINFFPTETLVQVPEYLKRYYFHQSIGKLKLKAILVVLPSKSDYYLYVNSKFDNHPLQFLVMKNDSDIIRFTSGLPSPELQSNETLHSDIMIWNIPQDGYYFLVLNSLINGLKKEEIKFFQNETEIIPILCSQNTINAPVFYLLKLKNGLCKSHKILSKQVISFEHFILESPHIPEFIN